MAAVRRLAVPGAKHRREQLRHDLLAGLGGRRGRGIWPLSRSSRIPFSRRRRTLPHADPGGERRLPDRALDHELMRSSSLHPVEPGPHIDSPHSVERAPTLPSTPSTASTIDRDQVVPPSCGHGLPTFSLKAAIRSPSGTASARCAFDGRAARLRARGRSAELLCPSG